MEFKKKGFKKWAMMGLFAVIVLGLTGCNDSYEPARAFGVEDLPQWVRGAGTDADWEMFFDELTDEALELFFTEGLGAMNEPPVAPEGSGYQHQMAAPGQNECAGAMRMNENGMECVDLEDLLDSEDLDDETRERIEEVLRNQ